MSRIATVFKNAKHKALIAYITIGYPSLQSTTEVATLLAEAGCDIIELGIPFSDPMADGVTIQNATHQALLNGVTPAKCLEIARQVSSRVSIPLTFMGYLNPILSYGIESFCADCASSGIDGLIIPDLPPGEMPDMETQARKRDIDIICFLAPNSSDERIKQVAAAARGFIYLVSVTGTTGTRDSFATNLVSFTQRVRHATDKPICIGFGISNREQAAYAASLADGIIIGSRIIQLMENSSDAYKKLRDFITEIRQGIDGS